MSRWALFFLAIVHPIKTFFGQTPFGRLYLIFLIALFSAFMVADRQAIADRLLQSPPSSPVDTPTPPPPPPTATPLPPTNTPAPVEAPPTNTPQPTAPPAPTDTPTLSSVESTEASPTEEATQASQDPPTVEPTVEAPPTEPPPATEEPEARLAEPPPGPQPQPIQIQPRDVDTPFEVEETGESPNFILDQVELIDSVAVSGAYVWLCCGIGLMLLTPLFFLMLYIRGRSRILREDDF